MLPFTRAKSLQSSRRARAFVFTRLIKVFRFFPPILFKADMIENSVTVLFLSGQKRPELI